MKTVYQADDGKVFETQAACVFYEAMEGCEYCYVSSNDRKYLADHMVANLSKPTQTELLNNETLSPSIQTQLPQDQPLDTLVRSS